MPISQTQDKLLLTDQKLPSFDLIVPCYNPPKGWEKNFIEKVSQLRKHLEDVTINIILVNDGSTQNFSEKEVSFLTNNCANLEIVTQITNQGKGSALRKGVALAKSKLQIFTDIDFPYTLPSILAIYKTLITGADVALGNRKSDYYQTVPFARRVISKFLRWVLKTVLKLPITDTQCGLKGFNAKGKEVFLNTKINRFLFDLEFVKMATSKNTDLSVTPVEVKLRPDVVFSKMNYKVLLGESVNFARLFLGK